MAALTPFRFPGSKCKSLPTLSKYLDRIIKKQFVDVFVGGGSVLLDVAERYPNIQLFTNDKDYNIYCFWNVITDEKIDQLLELMKQKVTLKLFHKLRETKTNDEVESAYKAIFFNRTTFSGISTSGPIGGKDQKSEWTVDCRYNYKILRQKILYCNKLLSGRTVVENKDFSEYKPLIKTDYPTYLDPPFYTKGDTLYPEKMNHDEHANLANILTTRKNWVLSYDDCPEIRTLYYKNKITNLDRRYCINGEKYDWKDKNELIISKIN